jgi:hypothetical protein
MNNERETCAICFQDYLVKNTKDHQCPDVFCGACGEQYDPTTEQDENGFHLSEICGANDEETETDNTDLYLAIIEDISHVIAKHLPRFDNNIKAETWKLLNQFTDETITQLTDPALNCECGFQH